MKIWASIGHWLSPGQSPCDGGALCAPSLALLIFPFNPADEGYNDDALYLGLPNDARFSSQTLIESPLHNRPSSNDMNAHSSCQVYTPFCPLTSSFAPQSSPSIAFINPRGSSDIIHMDTILDSNVSKQTPTNTVTLFIPFVCYPWMHHNVGAMVALQIAATMIIG